MTQIPAVALSNISREIEGKSVLSGLDLSITPGTILGLLGRNGAGKTTMIECLLGFQQPDAGQVRVWGESPEDFSDAVRERIGYVPQRPEAFTFMRAGQMLDYVGAFYQRWDKDRVSSLMDRWSLRRDAVIHSLSPGEQQRLALIRALGHAPDLLVLDEPVSSLDPLGRRDFLRELIERSIDDGTTVMFSTHIVTDLERVAMDVAVLKDGRIVLHKPLDEIKEQLRRVQIDSALLAGIELGDTVLARHSEGTESTLIVTAEGLTRLQASTAEALRADALGLEDLFVEMLR